MSKYIIWDKVSKVKTPSGEVFTASEWLERYPAYKDDDAIMVLASGFYNGALIAELSQLKEMCEEMGAQFDSSLTNEELLFMIDQFERDRIEQRKAQEKARAEQPTTEERIAAALEFQNLMMM